MVRAVVVVAVLFAGCIEPGAVVCGDKTCPADTTCDEVGGYCLTEAQATACTDIPDGKPCDAAGTPGICIRRFCEPGCGDGVTAPTEQCDDANFASHDGCSSQCEVEVPTWIEEVPGWRGLTQQSAVYHGALAQIVMIGGLDADGASDAIWQYNPANAGAVSGGWKNVTAAFAPSERPSARFGASIAYDSVHEVIVLHGGVTAGGLTGETWEYAASARRFEGELIGVWTLKSPNPTPIPRAYSAMTYDAGLGKTVLYGGILNAPLDRDTWLYENGTWTSLNTAFDPSMAPRASMAYDVARDTTVMFGGGAPSTFEFDGANWTKLDPTIAPGARRAAMMTYDPVRQRLVLFGGAVGSTLDTVASDTWTYNGTWQQLSGTTNPPGRQAAVLVADPTGGRLILAGGTVGEDPPFDDVWELSSTGWTGKTVRFEPPPTTGAAGAYSLDDRALVVVGGTSNTSASNFEVWRHDGLRWGQLDNAPVDRFSHGVVYDPDHRRFVMTGGRCGDVHPNDCDPAVPQIDWPSTTYALDQATRVWSKLPATWEVRFARSAFAMVYDEAVHEIVMFGGFSANMPTVGGTTFTDTWVSDGTTLTQLVTAEHPAVSSSSSPALVAWDPIRAAVVLFDLDGVTWEFRDHQWVRLIEPAESGPPGRNGGAMVYDPLRKRFVIMGGSDKGASRLFDIWELDTATLTWSQVFVTGANPLPRSGFVLAAHANARALILYGGAGGTGFARNDTWRLQYVSTSLEEDCTDGEDTDGDAQNDDEDPDCIPPPP